ncbi:MAG: hypothetical protein JW888_01445, partial [Pirellulales bacterium]|nr:hypothetical protein [Pirellulales bacterium]
MRLTLRALLAYLDDILESEDAEDIGKRIQESEVASALLHRVRDVMRRLRLQAPDVEESKKGLDPNTVAEYLDHVLPDERVPDFERICLESDMHLAEVASCHQILALVLGEPAEVDPASREHMYSLPQVATELEAMEARQEEGDDGRTGAVPPPPPRRPRPVVPDYLREPARKRSSSWAVAIVVLVVVAVIGWVVVDPFGLLRGDPSGTVAQGTSPGKPLTSPEHGKPTSPPPLQTDQPDGQQQLPDGATETETIVPVTGLNESPEGVSSPEPSG